MTNECSNKKHWQTYRGYLYTCKKCHDTEDKRTEPYPDGSRCHCPCGHNTFTCTICWKPVKIIRGMYWFVGQPEHNMKEDRVGNGKPLRIGIENG